MNWRDQLRPASFRGIKFFVDSHDTGLGRHTVQHDYPARDLPFVEDLGGKGRQVKFEAYVLGANYMDARDKLIAEIAKAGPGRLVHPYLGDIVVTLTDASLRESTSEGGMARFTLTFVESTDNVTPDSVLDTASSLRGGINAAITSIQNDFAGVFNVLSTLQFVADEAVNVVTDTLGAVDRLVGSVTGPIAAAIRTPFNMAAAITGGIARITATLKTPDQALRLLISLLDAGKNAKAVPLVTPARIIQARNQEAIARTVQRAAVVELARYGLTAPFTARDSALAHRDLIADAVDAQLESVSVVDGAPIADDVFAALTDLRAASARDLTLRAAKLPRLVRYTPPATLPALVIAYQIYGDAARADEIIARNNIANPLFVPGGIPLQVLADA